MDLRREERYSIAVSGHYRRGTGVRYDVAIRNLSEYGCLFYDFVGRLEPGSEITVRIGTVGPIGARVKWVSQRQVGVEFEQPLYPSVLDHIIAEGGTNEVWDRKPTPDLESKIHVPSPTSGSNSRTE